MDTETPRQRADHLITELDEERQSWISYWTDLYDYHLPRGARFQTSDANRGERKHHRIIDNTATLAVRTLAAGMMSGYTSPARPWFVVSLEDRKIAERANVRRWLDASTEVLRQLIDRAGFYQSAHNGYLDLGIAGTTAIVTVEDEITQMRCYHQPIGSYWLGQDERRMVNTFAREYTMTVRQLVARFGLDACSDSVRDAWDRGQRERRLDVRHLIAPNDDHDPRKLAAKHKRWKSCYYEKGRGVGEKGGEFLRESGFDEFPVLAPRWNTTGEDTWGESPAMDALGDVMGLQREQKDKAKAIAKMVDPPVTGPAILKQERVSLLPGDITYGDVTQGAQGLRPVHEVRLDVSHLTADIEDVRYRIREAYFADLFKMLAYSDRRQMTAREVEERHEEKLLMLGPVLQKLNGELLGPLVDRAFAIAVRFGLLPPPPRELEGMPLKIVFVSILAQAQKMLDIGTIERLVGFVGNLAQVYPGALDKLDGDQAVDEMAERLGTPAGIVRSDDEVEQLRASRAQAQARAQAMEQAAVEAKTAKDLAAADMGGDNALTHLLRGVA